MCGDDERSFRTDGAVLSVLFVSIIPIRQQIIVIPIVIVTIICLAQLLWSIPFKTTHKDISHFCFQLNSIQDSLSCMCEKDQKWVL